jgi:Tfp pilus assembly protein PilF
MYYLWCILSKKGNSLLPAIITVLCLFAGCATNRTNGVEKARALENMGTSLILQGQFRAALEQFLKAVEIDPENPELHHNLALVYQELGEYDLSLQHFQKALTINPKFSEARNNMGVLYVQLREWDLALQCFQKAVDDILYKTPHFAYHNIGSVYFHKGQYLKAIENYQKALRLEPTYLQAYYDLASAYEAINRMEEAIQTYQEIFRINPQSWDAHVYLAKLYVRLNMPQDAVRELEMVIKSDPRSPAAGEAKGLLDKIR